MRSWEGYRCLMLVIMLMLSVASYADSVVQTGASSSLESGDEPDTEQFPSWITSSGNWLEQQRDSFSDTVLGSATGIDAYLARDSIDESLINESHVKIQIRHRYEKSGVRDVEAKIKVRVRLPNSKRRLKLTFDSSPDDFDSISERQLELTPGFSSPRNAEGTAVAGLGIEKYLGRNWDSSYNVGMKLRWPLDPYVRAHWVHSSELGDHWRRRFLQRFSYFHTEGWKSEAHLDLYRPINDSLMFQSSSGAQYLDRDDRWELFQNLSLHQRISSDTAYEHQIGMSAITRPSLRTEGYWLRTKWRHRLYKQWLFGKVVPELFWGREDSFKLAPSLLFELEVFFGATP